MSKIENWCSQCNREQFIHPGRMRQSPRDTTCEKCHFPLEVKPEPKESKVFSAVFQVEYPATMTEVEVAKELQKHLNAWAVGKLRRSGGAHVTTLKVMGAEL